MDKCREELREELKEIRDVMRLGKNYAEVEILEDVLSHEQVQAEEIENLKKENKKLKNAA